MREAPEPPEGHAWGLHGLDLIQESSRDNVLSELKAGAASRPGDLRKTLGASGRTDRDRDDA